MGLLEQTELSLKSLLERTLLSRMGLPGRTELVLTNLLIDLRTNFIVGLSGLQTDTLQTDTLQTDTLQGNMGKSSCFKLKHMSQANTFEETDTISLILLALGLMELYIDAANLTFLSSIKRSILIIPVSQFGFAVNINIYFIYTNSID